MHLEACFGRLKLSARVQQPHLGCMHADLLKCRSGCMNCACNIVYGLCMVLKLQPSLINSILDRLSPTLVAAAPCQLSSHKCMRMLLQSMRKSSWPKPTCSDSQHPSHQSHLSGAYYSIGSACRLKGIDQM
jgi:hypothetical protein